jgi:hypothetical protein
LLIGAGKIAFGETQIIQGIQQVGFADPIIPANADDPFLKGKGCPGIVLELEEGYILYTEQRRLIYAEQR